MRLFISYTQQDLELVRELVEHLREAGHEFSAGGMVPLRDDIWQDQLRDVIRDSDAFVYAITPYSMESEWCRWEYITAIEEGIPLIPVMLENTSLDMHLDEHPYADFTDGFEDERRVDAFINNLDRIMVTVPLEEIPEKSIPASKPTRFATELADDLLEYTDMVDPVRVDEDREVDEDIVGEAAPMPAMPPDPRLSAPAPDMKTHIAPATFEAELKKRASTRRNRMLVVGGAVGAALIAIVAVVAAISIAIPIITFDPTVAMDEAQSILLSEPQTALSLYDRIIEREPRNIQAYMNRAFVHTALGDNESALADYERVLRIDATNALAYSNRGNLYASMGEYLLALDDYNTGIEVAPESAVLHFNRGNTFRELGANRQAIANYNRSIQINPENAAVYMNRGIAYGNLQEYENAISSLNQAIDLAPNFADAYAMRGLAFQLNGQPEAALADYDRNIEILGDSASPIAVEGIQQLRGDE